MPQTYAVPGAQQSLPELGSYPTIRINLVAVIGFFSICALTLLNLNFFTRLILDTEQVLSIFYLLACMAILFALKFPVGKSIGIVGGFWLFNIGVYLAISTRGGLGVDSLFFTSPGSNFYRVITAQLITVAAAAGARHILLAGKLQLTLRILFCFTVLAGCTIILAKVFPALVVKNSQGRMAGVFTDANRAGHALCLAAVFGFACLTREKSILLRGLMFAGLAALIPNLLLTYSRSSIVFMALVVMLQFVVSPSLIKNRGTIIAILIMAVGVPLGIGVAMNQESSHVNKLEQANSEAQQDRLQSFFRIMQGEVSDTDTGHRFTVWGHGIKYFLSSPIIGVGFHELVRMREINLGCHNTFIRIFGEGGLFCGLLYIASLLFMAWSSWRSKMPEVRCLGVGFVLVYACSAMVAHTLLTTRNFNVGMGIVIGLVSGAASLHQSQLQQKRAMAMQSAQAQLAAAAAAAPPPQHAIPARQ